MPEFKLVRHNSAQVSSIEPAFLVFELKNHGCLGTPSKHKLHPFSIEDKYDGVIHLLSSRSFCC
jgi:hypothetical protein